MNRRRRAGKPKDQCEHYACYRKKIESDPNDSNTWLGLCEIHTKAATKLLSESRSRFYNA